MHIIYSELHTIHKARILHSVHTVLTVLTLHLTHSAKPIELLELVTLLMSEFNFMFIRVNSNCFITVAVSSRIKSYLLLTPW